MVSEDFFEFVELVEQYTPYISEEEFKTICSFESFKEWEDKIIESSKKFKRSIFSNSVDNPNFKQHLVKVALILQTYIKENSTLQYPLYLNGEDYVEFKGKYFYDKYHKVLLNQVKSAYNSVKTNMCDEKEMTETYWMNTGKPYNNKPSIDDTKGNPISDFYNVIWTFDKGQKIIDSINKGEFTLEQYEEMLYNKRQAFDECLIDSVFKKVNIGFLYNVINRLYNVLCKDYSDFDFSKDDIETKCHYIRYKQLAFAVNHSKDILGGLDEIPSKDDGTDEELKQMYLSKTNVYYMNKSDEELKEIYDEIKDEYLSRDSSFEQFRYCMTGQGKPTARISWVGQKDTLAYFIETFFEDDGRKWKKSEGVFGMKVANSNLQNSKKANPFAYLKKKK